MTEHQTDNAPTYEIAARLVKVILLFGSLLTWLFFALGAYSVYKLWTTEKGDEWVLSNVQSSLELGWVAIGLIVAVRLVQIAIGWTFLAPIEAKIRGINLRDPEVAQQVREETRINLSFEGVSLLAYVAVPLLIAHFRFDYFV